MGTKEIIREKYKEAIEACDKRIAELSRIIAWHKKLSEGNIGMKKQLKDDFFTALFNLELEVIEDHKFGMTIGDIKILLDIDGNIKESLLKIPGVTMRHLRSGRLYNVKLKGND